AADGASEISFVSNGTHTPSRASERGMRSKALFCGSLVLALAAGCAATSPKNTQAPSEAVKSPFGAFSPIGASGRIGSSVAIAQDGARSLAFAADEDEKAIFAFDIGRREQIGKTALPGVPSQVIALPGGRLAVALRDRAEIVTLRATGRPDPLFAVESTV